MSVRNKTVHLTIDNSTLDRYAEYYFALHPRAKKRPIKNPYHESINTWMIMRRAMMNALKQKWKEFIIWFANDAGVSMLCIKKCIITQTVYYPSHRRHDTDNSVPKFILDGLVEARVIEDDDMNCVTELRLRCDICEENPRTEIKIKIIE